MWYRQAILPVLVLLSLAAVPAAAQDRTASLGGFGGMSLNGVASIRPDFGITVAKELTPQIHAIGEFGRVGDMLPPLAADLIALTPYDFRVSALYGEGGVRLLAGGGAIDPYVEATAGVARLTPRLSGLGPRVDPFATAALNLLSRTDPMVGIGGGVLLRGGPLVADIGYRYKQILGNDALATVLSGGTNLRAHQVRFGVGIRF